MFVLVVAIGFLGAAVFFLGEVVTLPARERSGSFRLAATYGRKGGLPAEIGEEGLRQRALVPLQAKLATAVLKLSPKASMETVSFKLLQAGIARRVSPTGFLALKGLLGAGGVLLGATTGSSSSATNAFLFAVALGAGGFIGPDFVVSKRARARQEKIRAQLPDALDLLAVTVEAGLGFDGAVAKLTEKMHGPLTEEFALTLGEMRIGESRTEALRKLADRVGIPELGSFTRAIIQADQFGISLGRILRVQAIDTRNRRQMAAEERAMKAPVKMLFPTVAFIFPSMFLVILGPAFLNLSKII